RVDDELCINSETSKRLIHLLSALDWHIEVPFSSKEQSRCFDTICVQEWIGKLHVGVPRFWIPRGPNFIIVLNDVLVSSIKGNCEGGACATRRAFESSVARDHVVCQDAAVTPTTNAEAIRVSDTDLNNVIDASLKILNFIVSPVGKD